MMRAMFSLPHLGHLDPKPAFIYLMKASEASSPIAIRGRSYSLISNAISFSLAINYEPKHFCYLYSNWSNELAMSVSTDNANRFKVIRFLSSPVLCEPIGQACLHVTQHNITQMVMRCTSGTLNVGRNSHFNIDADASSIVTQRGAPAPLGQIVPVSYKAEICPFSEYETY